MRVFTLRTDVNRFQSFLPKHAADWKKLQMNCTSRRDKWVPPEVYVYMPNLLAGDFYAFSIAALICSPRATAILQEFLEPAGELLRLPYAEQEFTILNITPCLNCLDQEATKWSYYEENGEQKKLRILEHAFDSTRLSRVGLFKIIEEPLGDVFLAERPGDVVSLRSVVESSGLQGLIFNEVWSDE